MLMSYIENLFSVKEKVTFITGAGSGLGQHCAVLFSKLGSQMEQQMVMVNNIANSKFTLIPHCGHMLTLEQPEAVTALVRLWINCVR